ncbi:TRAP dicarboxylate transporter, DctM subunit domain protein [Bordetella bronchiseptica]|nr:TRAP dicarboxylate transporter, DctM subunit domain protein [Bordetella bronchiseptica]
MYSPASTNPGTIAARNMSPIERPSWSARMISTSEGGMICDSVPEAAITPLASRLSYP